MALQVEVRASAAAWSDCSHAEDWTPLGAAYQPRPSYFSGAPHCSSACARAAPDYRMAF